ncbi:hypothetical protein [Flexivirga oryzae]|uniref:Uncharacterized protein n=1 Tax=Flexivirga oryzae TaxID=1794944 RepID=A0A839NE68_9MICO|nr:hypothetical protein [Flexivirga oryzae]MBB2892981.1 hypothetical protein [Flexivirga oryzae]
MQRRGVLPPDAPDPRIDLARRVRELAVPILGLVPQPSLEDTGSLDVAEGSDASGLLDASVGVTYTLWRNPDDRSDPVNLAALTPEIRAALERTTPWPRPQWLIEHIERQRYPQLWLAVRTTWRRDGGIDLAEALVDHFDDVVGRDDGEDWADHRSAALRAAEEALRATTIQIDAVTSEAVEMDSHETLYAIGAHASPTTVATVVLPRRELRYVDIALATRPPGPFD